MVNKSIPINSRISSVNVTCAIGEDYQVFFIANIPLEYTSINWSVSNTLGKIQCAHFVLIGWEYDTEQNHKIYP